MSAAQERCPGCDWWIENGGCKCVPPKNASAASSLTALERARLRDLVARARAGVLLVSSPSTVWRRIRPPDRRCSYCGRVTQRKPSAPGIIACQRHRDLPDLDPYVTL